MASVQSPEEEVEIFRRKEWSNIMTKLLITLYKELSPKVGRNKEMTTCKEMYAKIAQIMTERGYPLTPAQIQQKWVSLVRSYRDAMTEANKQTVEKEKTSVYEKELYDIFKDKINMYPKLRRQPQTFQEFEIVHSACIVDELEEDTEDPFEAKIKEELRTSLVSLLQILIKQRERHHREKMSLLRKMMKLRKEIAEQRSKDRKELLEILKQNSLL